MIIVHGPEIVDWVHRQCNGVNPDPNTAQGLGLVSDRILAGVTYYNWNGHDIHCAAAGTVWPRRFLTEVFRYPFVQLGARRITAFVEVDNFASRRFVTRLGCVLEGRLSEACEAGDMLIYRMLKRECKFLREGDDESVWRQARSA